MSHKFIPGIASQSLGNPQHHGIKEKLEAAARTGLQAVEIFYEDIAQLASAYSNSPEVLAPQFQPTSEKTPQSGSRKNDEILLSCARQIRQWCLDAQPKSLEIICLQPFMHYEGLLDDAARSNRMVKLDLWIQLAKNLGTTLIQIPSNFLSAEECSGDRTRIVEDLRRVAEIGAKQDPAIRFAYEALCWGTHVNVWDAAWAIVKEVDMDNFGTCLDTFNIAGRVYADPERADGKTASAKVDMDLSVQKLRDTFSKPENLKKVFYLELCDGEMLDSEISPDHPWYNAEQPARMTWSRNARLFPFETSRGEAAHQRRNPGYLPIIQIFDALLDVGYEGYISFEVFNRSLNHTGPSVVGDHAMRAGKAWQSCARHIDHFMDVKRNAEREAHPADETAVAEHDSDATSLAEQDRHQQPSSAREEGNIFSISSRL